MKSIREASSIRKDRGVKQVPTKKVHGQTDNMSVDDVLDTVSVEEPLEVRVGYAEKDSVQQIAVTMRTPGNDEDLAVGFLFTEGIISSKDDVANVTADMKCNGVTVQLHEHVELDPAVFSRHSFVASSCGVCGKKTIAAVRVKRQFTCPHDEPIVPAELIHKLPDMLRSQQDNFDHTGGIHASCLFGLDGYLVNIKEDVGRHNALDKLIGAELISGHLPLNDKILMLSGRASFELIQKAAHAGLAVVAAVGAPSSLAVQLADECDITLLGFVRDGRFNIYSGAHRIKVS
ncbi:MAG: formate dehydrogenase accessory sulfurtransferase FdhD [Cyanobacteria bacterium SZAS-4]|nr:formate dehydrogenase accessory sulfurtransferase FdhD [Cyanobacteria bacterium SZAS-4]